MLPFSLISRAIISTTMAPWKNTFHAKQVLFEGCGTDPPRAAVLNVDDEYGRQLLKLARKKSAEVFSYGLSTGDFHVDINDLEITPRGSRFQMLTPAGEACHLDAADRQSKCLQCARRRGCRLCA